VEVWGSSPHEPTIPFNHLRKASCSLANQFNTEFNIESVHVWSDDSSRWFSGHDDWRQPVERLTFRLHADMTVMFHHLPGDVSSDAQHGGLWCAAFQQFRYALMPKIVKPEPPQ
jgi:hypothetical protein